VASYFAKRRQGTQQGETKQQGAAKVKVSLSAFKKRHSCRGVVLEVVQEAHLFNNNNASCPLQPPPCDIESTCSLLLPLKQSNKSSRTQQ